MRWRSSFPTNTKPRSHCNGGKVRKNPVTYPPRRHRSSCNLTTLRDGRELQTGQAAEVFRKCGSLITHFVFPGEKRGTHRTDLPKDWEEYLKQAGIENFHWHDLRHSFASRLGMLGVDLYAVKELLGHSDFKMTMRYAHLSPGHLKAAVEVLDNQLAPKLAPASRSVS